MLSALNEALAHTNDSQGARAVASGSKTLDSGGLGSVRHLGPLSEGLRPTAETNVSTESGSDQVKAAQNEREEDSYVIEAGLKMLKVFSVLEPPTREPASIKRISKRAGFNYSFTRAALITLKRGGFAKQILVGRYAFWTLGPKAEVLGARIASARLSDPQSADR